MTTATATATTETTAPAATAPVKAPSKMARCKVLYDEVFAPGYVLNGETQRAVFIKRAMAELEMSKHGANTYYQNLSNDARGLGKYKYNKYQGKAGSKAETAKSEAKGKTEAEAGLDLPGAVGPSKSDIKAAEQAAAKTTNDLTQRWQVLDGDEVVSSFATRNAAKNAAVGGLTWADAKAVGSK